jgi:endonuclease III
MTYTVDEPLAELVFGKIWARYESGEYPYNSERIIPLLPQTHLPPSLPLGGKEEAYYWLIICQWMRITNTEVASKQVAKLYEYLAKRRCLNPFDPFDAVRLKPQRITNLLKEVGLGLDESAPLGWIENARRIVEQWDGDVLKIFDGVSHYDQVWPRLINDPAKGTGFAGFQHKMASMILYFLSERSLIKPFPFPPPVDFHLLRVAVETGIVRRQDENPRIAYSQKEYESIGEVLRKVYFDYSERHGLAGNRFNDAVWLLSKRLCSRNPGNRSSVAKKDPNGGTGRGRKITPYIPDWSDPKLLKRYERSCGSCPIDNECKYNVPSANRYVGGGLTIRSLRERPPHDALFSHHVGRTT